MRGSGVFYLIVGSFLFLAMGVAVTIYLPYRLEPAPTELARASRPVTESEMRGRKIYAREGCWYCHTQQVRAPEANKGFVLEPGDIGPESLEGDYAFQKPVFWGTERQGPDLTHQASRLRGATPEQQRELQLLHLKNPRSISAGSVMPSYAYLSDRDLNALVDYLLTLK
ncbi:MAG: cbb3-type cytochrome c oxidase subunit II [Chloroflexi bacterium]|nr:cbb3-type cytochrome c oxidase subunit II [Chloroflexota bacterium]